MDIRFDKSGKVMTAYLSGDIDHHTAAEIRLKIDETVIERSPDKLILDYGEVSFMDSSGIGLIMGRHRLMKEHGKTIEIANVPPSIYKVVKLAGIEKLGKVTVRGNMK